MNKALMVVLSIAVVSVAIIFTNSFFQETELVNSEDDFKKVADDIVKNKKTMPEVSLAINHEVKDVNELDDTENHAVLAESNTVTTINDATHEHLADYTDDWTYFKRDELFVFMSDSADKYPNISIGEIKCESDSCLIEYVVSDDFSNTTSRMLVDYEKKYSNDFVDMKSMLKTPDGMKVVIEARKKEG